MLQINESDFLLMDLVEVFVERNSNAVLSEEKDIKKNNKKTVKSTALKAKSTYPDVHVDKHYWNVNKSSSRN